MPTSFAFERFQGFVVGDRKDPGGNARAAVEGGRFHPHHQHGVVEDLVDQLRTASERLEKAPKPAIVVAVQGLESGPVFVGNPCQELDFLLVAGGTEGACGIALGRLHRVLASSFRSCVPESVVRCKDASCEAPVVRAHGRSTFEPARRIAARAGGSIVTSRGGSAYGLKGNRAQETFGDRAHIKFWHVPAAPRRAASPACAVAAR